MRTVAIIPARGGSKGIPGKNMKEFCKKPLISWTIDAAIQSTLIDDFVVSTDSKEIFDFSADYGVKTSMRPSELATDTSPIIDTILYTILNNKEIFENTDYCCLLQPTSPLRTSQDIDLAIKIAYAKKIAAVVTVNRIFDYMFNCQIDKSGKIILENSVIRKKYMPRQNIATKYFINGAVYVNKISSLVNEKTFYPRNIYACEIPQERSVQIDDIPTFFMAKALMEMNK